MMGHLDIVEELITTVEAEDVPMEYIAFVKIVDSNGVEHTMRGQLMEDFLLNPDRTNVTEARVALDLRKLRVAVLFAVNSFFEGLDRRLQDLNPV